MMCFYCNSEKEESLFRRKTGKALQCKACYSAYIANYIRTRPEKVKKNREYVQKSKPRRRDIRRQFLCWLKSDPCLDCGQKYHPEVMEFDHTQDGTKGGYKFAVGAMAFRTVNEESLWSEILKCEIVCANCHRIRTVKRRKGLEAYFQEVDRLGTAPSSEG